VRNLIIGVNALVYLWELAQGPYLQRAFYLYGIVPVRYSNPDVALHFSISEQIVPFFASMFLHGGFLHLLGNMWFLYIFGDNVEDRLGPFRFALFYLMSGVAAGLIHLISNWHSQLPTIGASGAIAGVMGAYFLLYPRARVLTLIPIFFIPLFFEVPAFFFLGYWVLIQLLYGTMTHGMTGGVAWWAHVGGFLFGMASVRLFEFLPRTGVTEKASRYTQRRRTPRLQHIRLTGPGEELDTHGIITVTPREAALGTRKLVSIPYRRRTVVVTIPAGVKDGTKLRLQGLGRKSADGDVGDLYLTVRIRGWD
ncbi:MAG: rhomboid family intramembrane serine protease, partial [Deltaproteobacteria bacterium]|nr:rhomboid family intramembrane serine protease [Deltaproteobacteria bacterium]